MSRLSGDAVAARWDGWDGQQDGRPRPAGPRDPRADQEAFELIVAASQVFSPQPAGQAS